MEIKKKIKKSITFKFTDDDEFHEFKLLLDEAVNPQKYEGFGHCSSAGDRVYSIIRQYLTDSKL
jgi:hypothetical protein